MSKEHSIRKQKIRLGKNLDGVESLNAVLDTVMVFSGVLTDSQIATLYNGTYVAHTTNTNTTNTNTTNTSTRSYGINEEIFFDNVKVNDSRRGEIKFNNYVDPKDPGSVADWISYSNGQIIVVKDDNEFATALKNVKPGETIQLRGGIYNYFPKITLSGKEGAPIIIESYPGEWAVFEGAKSWDGIRLDGASWINIRKIEIQNGNGSLFLWKSHHILVEGVRIHNNNNRGLDVVNANHHIMLRYNEAYYNMEKENRGQNGDGFSLWGYGGKNGIGGLGEGIILEKNVAWGNSDDGIDLFMNATSITLRNNIARSNGYNVRNLSGFKGNGNGFKLGPTRLEHVVIGNISDNNEAEGYDHNLWSNLSPQLDIYFKGNVAESNKTDYEGKFSDKTSVFQDNYTSGGKRLDDKNPNSEAIIPVIE